MVNVRYTGSAEVRSISKADFKRNGVDSPGVKWTKDKPVRELSDEAAGWLLKNVGNEFAEDAEVSKGPSTQTGKEGDKG